MSSEHKQQNSVIIFIKERVALLGGALLLAVLGHRRFHQIAQKPSLLGKLAAAFSSSLPGRVVRNFGLELPKQQRGTIIPLIEAAIEKDDPKMIVEIGCGNGDVTAYLAERHPDIEFVGVDLSIVNAERKYQIPNLRFVKGYALDLIRDGEVRGDVAFGASTICIFTPKELDAYLAAMQDFHRFIVSDPVTQTFHHTNDKSRPSLHMASEMWCHNYIAAFDRAGFSMDVHETRPLILPSHNKARVLLASAVKPPA